MAISQKIKNIYTNPSTLNPKILNYRNPNIIVSTENNINIDWIKNISETANNAAQRSIGSKSITVAYPEINDDILLFYNEYQSNVHQLISVLQSSSAGNVNYNIEYSNAINSNRNKVSSSNNLCTGMNVVSSFSNPTIPANNFVWLKIGQIDGSVQQFHVTIDIKK